MTQKQEIAELRKDIGIFFKWYVHYISWEMAKANKAAAVRAQNFEAAANYRDQEVSVFKEWEEVNRQMLEIHGKYVDEPFQPLEP